MSVSAVSQSNSYAAVAAARPPQPAEVGPDTDADGDEGGAVRAAPAPQTGTKLDITA